jgi:peptide/nickel transport system permease protein
MSVTTAAEAELAVQSRQAVARSEGYWAGVWKRVKRDPVTIFCASILLLMLLTFVFAPLLAPHDPFQGSMIRRLRPLGRTTTSSAPTSWGATC